MCDTTDVNRTLLPPRLERSKRSAFLERRTVQLRPVLARKRPGRLATAHGYSPTAGAGVGMMAASWFPDLLTSTEPKGSGNAAYSGSAPGSFTPLSIVVLRFVRRWRIKADHGSAVLDLFENKILEAFHAGAFLGDLIGQMRWNDHDAVTIADEHVPGENGGVTAANGHVDVERFVES